MIETPTPTQIKLLQKQQTLTVEFDDGREFIFSCEFLRRHSPSADVQGHGGQKPPPPTVKPDINILQIDPVGNYAVKLHFNDGHQSGLFSWRYLYELGMSNSPL